jgi:hypothetical protein
MKQTRDSVKRSVAALRKLIDSSPDPVVCRIAYAVETALRWSIEDTTRWPRPEKEVLEEADILRHELRAPR